LVVTIFPEARTHPTPVGVEAARLLLAALEAVVRDRPLELALDRGRGEHPDIPPIAPDFLTSPSVTVTGMR
jgi:hypothetical protein